MAIKLYWSKFDHRDLDKSQIAQLLKKAEELNLRLDKVQVIRLEEHPPSSKGKARKIDWICENNPPVKVIRTDSAPRRRDTSMVRHSLVYSSMIVSRWKALPSWDRAIACTNGLDAFCQPADGSAISSDGSIAKYCYIFTLFPPLVPILIFRSYLAISSVWW